MTRVTDSANLPLPLTPFIGREQEVAAIKARLLRDEIRLLTLTGPGGIGKTRLGLQVAQALAVHFSDSAIFVSLASISDPTLVIYTIGQALGLRETSDQPLFTQLRVHLRDKQLLLFLDNFEQVVMTAPQLVELLQACPKLKILVTSRMALRLSGGYEYPVPPLTLPDLRHLPDLKTLAKIETIALFIERAAAIKPDFRLTATNVKLVAEICDRLEGLPLAVELAAALVKSLPLRAILSRLEHRLHVLIDGPRDLPSRQQTLRNTIAWSYNLLNAGEQQLFRRLSVFVGGCTLEAVEAIYSDKMISGQDDEGMHDPITRLSPPFLSTLSSLIDKNLLQQIAPDDSEPRYTILETIREYGLECLAATGEVDSMRQTHLHYYLALAETGEAQLKTAGQETWLAWLELEHANLRAALRWAIDQAEVELALRLSGALGHFWVMHGHLSEGRRWIQEALAKIDFGESFPDMIAESENQAQFKITNPSQKPPVGKSKMLRALAKALNTAGLLARYQSDLGPATSLCGRSLHLRRRLDDPGGVAAALDNLAAVARNGGNYTAAHSMYQESLAIYRTLNDRWGVAHTSTYLGIAIWYQGDLATAQPWVEEGLALFRTLGVDWDIAMTLIVLAAIVRDKKEYVTAHKLAGEALTNMRKLGDRRSVALALIVLGDSCLAQGDRVAALPLFKESLTIFSELGDRYNLAECLMGVARAVADDQPAQAAGLCAAHDALHHKLGTFVPDTEQMEYQQVITRLRTVLGEATFATAWTMGRTMTWDKAIQEALDVLNLALTATPTKLEAQSVPTAISFGQAHLVGLTARELEVLRLVANGLTDAQIAEQLVISRRTVNTHLSSIYSKLGVNSRMTAVRYALDHHLL